MSNPSAETIQLLLPEKRWQMFKCFSFGSSRDANKIARRGSKRLEIFGTLSTKQSRFSTEEMNLMTESTSKVTSRRPIHVTFGVRRRNCCTTSLSSVNLLPISTCVHGLEHHSTGKGLNEICTKTSECHDHVPEPFIME